jgi:hypothetical protein
MGRRPVSSRRSTTSSIRAKSWTAAGLLAVDAERRGDRVGPDRLRAELARTIRNASASSSRRVAARARATQQQARCSEPMIGRHGRCDRPVTAPRVDRRRRRRRRPTGGPRDRRESGPTGPSIGGTRTPRTRPPPRRRSCRVRAMRHGQTSPPPWSIASTRPVGAGRDGRGSRPRPSTGASRSSPGRGRGPPDTAGRRQRRRRARPVTLDLAPTSRTRRSWPSCPCHRGELVSAASRGHG